MPYRDLPALETAALRLCDRIDSTLDFREAVLALLREAAGGQPEPVEAEPVKLKWRDAADGSGWASWRIGKFSGVIALSAREGGRFEGYLAMLTGSDQMLVLAEVGGDGAALVREELTRRAGWLRVALEVRKNG